MQNACATLYCHLWPVWLHHIFPHNLIKTRFSGGKNVIGHKIGVLIFGTALNSARYYNKCIYVFMYSTRYSCQILVKIQWFRQLFASLETSQVRFRSQFTPCEKCRWGNGTGSCFSPNTSVFLSQYDSTTVPYILHWLLLFFTVHFTPSMLHTRFDYKMALTM
jgi:hypothetical protein